MTSRTGVSLENDNILNRSLNKILIDCSIAVKLSTITLISLKFHRKKNSLDDGLIVLLTENLKIIE